ncbi:MAG TPA: SusC/RagA family TonB-linked outer membrane protein, partial [Bacteroidales bacterium]|nr:SusC/RagA family TonB-linked outer membrane protein [Bacteroidales bacterium]
MKRIKILFTIGLTVLYALNAQAQDNTIIRGRVVDKNDGQAVIGATIIEYDENERVIGGTTTNLDGDFILELTNPDHVVKVSFIGYKMQEIEKDPSKTVIVELEPSDFELDEVKIVAEAKDQSSLTNIADRDRASSSVKVDLMEAKDMGTTSAADALQGKVSGLDIIAASGDPGSGSQIVIRGLSSMGNSQPLIVIDGVPQFRVERSFDLSSADSEDISNLVNIALQDIKSIEVLKDAASTAIYGSRGADGVLLIETARGAMGDIKFDYQFKSSYNFQPPAIPMLDGNEYIMLQLEEWHNSRGVYDIPPEIAYDRDYVDFHNYSANTNWIEELTRDGVTQDHYFSLSGGGDKTRYFNSFSFTDELGTTIGTSAQRFSVRTNLDYFLSRKLLFQVKFNYVTNTREGNAELNRRNVREMAYIKAPNMSIWEYDSKGNPTGEYFTPINTYQGDGVSYYNPVAMANLSKDDRRYSRLENTFLLRYRINDLLTIRETVSFQFQGTERNQFYPYTTIGADWLNPYVNRAREDNDLDIELRTETQIAFNSPFQNENHELTGALTWITQQSEYEKMDIVTTNLPTTDIQDPAAESQINRIRARSGEKRSLGGVANINYKLLDRYMVQTILRADAASSFGENNRWGLFQGLAVGWRFSDEPVLESWNFLGESKLRYSWGVTGRRPKDVYARFANYESTSRGSYINRSAIIPSSVQLDNLKWETITSNNIGLELNLFENTLFIEAELYNKLTTDILFEDYDIPGSTGFSELQYFNGGELANSGWEIMTDVKAINKENLRLSFNFNASRNVNSFRKLPENFNRERSTSIGNGQYPLIVSEGEPIGSFYGFRYLGVWSSDEDVVARDADDNILLDGYGNPMTLTYNDSYRFQGGDPIYADLNHDGDIDLNDVEKIGDSNPDFVGGFGTNIRFWNFNFAMNFHYRSGFDIINQVALRTEGMNNRNNQSKAVLRRWRVEGQDEPNMLPKAYMNHPANNLGSDRYVEKGDFVRLNNVK